MSKLNIKLFLFLLITFSFYSCLSQSTSNQNKLEKFNLDLKNSDFSKSAKDAIIYLRSQIENPKFSSIDVEIYNFHGGVYQHYCRIEKKDDVLIFHTTIIGMDGSKKTSDRNEKISNFILSLNKLEQNSENQIVAAGNYQKIYIKTEQIEELFLTKKAFGLIGYL